MLLRIILKALPWIAGILGPFGSFLIGVYPRSRVIGYIAFASASIIWISYGAMMHLWPLVMSSVIYVVIEIYSIYLAYKKD